MLIAPGVLKCSPLPNREAFKIKASRFSLTAATVSTAIGKKYFSWVKKNIASFTAKIAHGFAHRKGGGLPPSFYIRSSLRITLS